MVSMFCHSLLAEEIIVGVLRTKSESYPHELDYSNNIVEMLIRLGSKVILIDYNELVDKKGDLLSEVEDFIYSSGITRVIIPGNYYNLDSEPFAPNTNRQDVTAILAKMAEEGKIYLMGICGGLQGIVHSKKIEIVKVKSIGGNESSHLVSDPDPHAKNVPLHKVMINPTSRLAKMLKNIAEMDENGWIYLYLPDAHTRVINNSVKNIQKLNMAGYNIVGFSNDGMIEIIEDKFGNIHFQDHPEGLVINNDFLKETNSSLRTKSADAVIVIFEDFLSR